MVADLAYWILLDFFIIEMKTVKDIVSADSIANLENNSKKTKSLIILITSSLNFYNLTTLKTIITAH